jgi:hypothetical protein
LILERSIDDKIRHGQINEQRPGTIVFHAPFQPLSTSSLRGWQDLIDNIRQPGPFDQGLRKIEITTGRSNAGILIFEPPHWVGRLVREPLNNL